MIIFSNTISIFDTLNNLYLFRVPIYYIVPNSISQIGFVRPTLVCSTLSVKKKRFFQNSTHVLPLKTLSVNLLRRLI